MMETIDFYELKDNSDFDVFFIHLGILTLVDFFFRHHDFHSEDILQFTDDKKALIIDL